MAYINCFCHSDRGEESDYCTYRVTANNKDCRTKTTSNIKLSNLEPPSYHFNNALAQVNPLPNAARQTRSPF